MLLDKYFKTNSVVKPSYIIKWLFFIALINMEIVGLRHVACKYCARCTFIYFLHIMIFMLLCICTLAISVSSSWLLISRYGVLIDSNKLDLNFICFFVEICNKSEMLLVLLLYNPRCT